MSVRTLQKPRVSRLSTMCVILPQVFVECPSSQPSTLSLPFSCTFVRFKYWHHQAYKTIVIMPSFNDLPPELMEMVLTESLQPHLDVCNQPITGSNKEEVYEALRSLAACIPPLISTSRAVAPNVIYVIRKNILPAIKTMINWLDNNVPPSHERDFDDDRGFPVFAIHVHGKFQGHTEGLRTGVLCCMKGLEEKYKIAAST